MADYKGKDENPDDLTQRDTFYEGKQDDDDFEKLVLRKAKGEYQLKLVKISSTGSKETLKGARFKVTLPGNKSQEGTTDQNGTFSIPNIQITDENVDTITIEEIEAPSGYKKLLESVQIEVTKKLEGGVYKATEIKLKNEKSSGIGEAQVESNLQNGIITITIPNEEKKFDLALRKYITKVIKANGEERELTSNESRVPKIDESPLTEGTKNTAIYKHKKDPVEVETGDKVIYKITIYNEGEKEGRATKIVDQLPTGLKFLEVLSGNFKEDSSKSYKATEDNTLNLIRKEENSSNLPAYKPGNLTSETGRETIEIKCEVTRNSRRR